MSHATAGRRRAAPLACLLLVAAVAAGCSDDEEKPLGPGTGRDLQTPSSQLTPPSPPPQ